MISRFIALVSFFANWEKNKIGKKIGNGKTFITSDLNHVFPISQISQFFSNKTKIKTGKGAPNRIKIIIIYQTSYS
jgi:hypothetical protein